MLEHNSKKEIRHQKIRALLNERETVELADLHKILGCSDSTIRNDLRYLESMGYLIRTFGGAMKAASVSVTTRSGDYQEEKRLIADYAFTHFVKPDQTITIDSGSTCIELALKISESDIPLNVITTSFFATSLLVYKDNIELNLIGGKYDANTGSFFDENSIEIIKTMWSDIFFMGAKGVSPSVGYSISSATEASLKRTMRQCSNRTVALLDHTKIGTVAFKRVCGVEDVDTIITDYKADAAVVEKLREKGLKVILVSPNGESMGI